METQLTVVEQSKAKFELACRDAKSLQIVDNFGAAFTAVNVVSLLREALTDEVMNMVFMPLMNTKIGFLTDRTGRPNSKGTVYPLYTIQVVRDAIIDAVSIGLLPTGNQFNIIADRMYPTKEGYTALLRKMNIKYFINVGLDKNTNEKFAELPVKIVYDYNGEKNDFSIIAMVKKDLYSSYDQLKGKAERRAKKALYEYVTGCDLGEGDAGENNIHDAISEDVTAKVAEEIKTENASIEIKMPETKAPVVPETVSKPKTEKKEPEPTIEKEDNLLDFDKK